MFSYFIESVPVWKDETTINQTREYGNMSATGKYDKFLSVNEKVTTFQSFMKYAEIIFISIFILSLFFYGFSFFFTYKQDHPNVNAEIT